MLDEKTTHSAQVTVQQEPDITEGAVPKTVGTTLSQQSLMQYMAGGGVLAVFAAAIYLFQMMQTAAQDQAKLEIRLQKMESQLETLVQTGVATNEKLGKLTERPLITERDFTRYLSSLRAANANVTIPEFVPRD